MNILSDKDRASSAWVKIEEYLNKKVSTLRERNDNQALTEDETKNIRAEIKVIKDLLNVTVKKDIRVREPQ